MCIFRSYARLANRLLGSVLLRRVLDVLEIDSGVAMVLFHTILI